MFVEQCQEATPWFVLLARAPDSDCKPVEQTAMYVLLAVSVITYDSPVAALQSISNVPHAVQVESH